MTVAKGQRGERRSTAPYLGRGALDGFEARLRPATGLRWPLGERLGPSEAIELAPAETDLLILHHNPAQRLLRGAVHESLRIELGCALAACQPGVLPMRRLVYRSGTDRLSYQATRATGALVLVATSAERHVITATLTLIAPDLDLDGVGPRVLAGTIHLARG